MEHELLESKATKTRRKNDADVPGQEQTQPVTSVQRILQLQRTIGNRAVGRRIRKKLEAIDPGDPYERKGDRVAEQVMRSLGLRIQPSVQRKALSEEDEDKENQPVQMTPFAVSIAPMVQRQMIPDEEKDEKPVQMEAVVQRSAHEGSFEAVRQPQIEVAGGSESHEIEADRAADQVAQGRSTRGAAVPRPSTPSVPTSGVPGLGSGIPMSPDLRHRYEAAFGWSFGGVRLHSGQTAAEAAEGLGARAFTHGRHIVFGSKVENPEAPAHQRTLAHELAHVVQQDKGVASGVQAIPRVTLVTPSALELGVGGRDITVTATVGAGAPANPALTWTINPGGAVPAGVSIIGAGRRVSVRSVQPPPGTLIGGTPITVRAGLTTPPGGIPDEADSAAINLVQVVNAVYNNNPAFIGVPSLVPGAPPANTGEPNRDGINGNTVAVVATTAPLGRPINVAFRRSLSGAVAGNIITPGRQTGNMQLRVTDTATGARLDEAAPSLAGGAALMAELAINPVPLRVSALVNSGALGAPYGFLSTITFARSDTTANALDRIVGEQVTLISDQLGRGPVNGAYNPVPNLALAVPANGWVDQIGAVAMAPIPGTAAVSIDVNRFVGPGVPHLPRGIVLRQEFIYFSWQGGGAVFSNVFASGRQQKTLVEQGANNFRFLTEHIFPGVTLTPVGNEPYVGVGPPLIVLAGVTATPTAAGAATLSADGVSTANLTVNAQSPAGVAIPGRTVQWTVLDGDILITAGNPAVLPAAATVRAGMRAGNFRVRAQDTVFPNRRVDTPIRVAPVRLTGMVAAPSAVPAGALITTVTITGAPADRQVNWSVDATSAARGVTVAPALAGPGGAMLTVVTRPAGFTGTVTVTATDSILALRKRLSVRFL